MKEYIIAFIIVVALSLLINVGIIKLICLCFGLAFSWKIAIGIWLVLVLLGNALRSNRK